MLRPRNYVKRELPQEEIEALYTKALNYIPKVKNFGSIILCTGEYCESTVNRFSESQKESLREALRGQFAIISARYEKEGWSINRTLAGILADWHLG